MEEIGKINIVTNPVGAKIYLNGQLQTRKSPSLIKNMPVGIYKLKLMLNGYEDYEELIIINSNETTDVNVIMKKEHVEILEKEELQSLSNDFIENNDKHMLQILQTNEELNNQIILLRNDILKMQSEITSLKNLGMIGFVIILILIYIAYKKAKE